MPDLFLGLDLGGTAIKAGLVDAAGQILAQTERPTGQGPDVVIANLAAAARTVVGNAGATLAQVAAVGVGAPGVLSTARGVVIQCANLPGFSNIPLRERLQQALGRPTVLENDANAAAYGEFWAGAGRGAQIRNLVMLTLGTGIGGGIILGGQVLHGTNDFAGEIGHTIAVPDGDPCGCGQRGCLEVYASASRLAQRATALVQAPLPSPSSLRAVLAATGHLTAADVARHAAAGDPVARRAWDEACKAIALACISIVHTLDPEMIVLAGGMSRAGGLLIDAVRAHFAAQYWTLTPPTVQIALAALGPDAGLIGAAGVARQSLLPNQPITPYGFRKKPPQTVSC